MGYNASAFEKFITNTISPLIKTHPEESPHDKAEYQNALSVAKPANTKATQACCTCKIVSDKTFKPPQDSILQKHHPRSSKSKGFRRLVDNVWDAEILIDGQGKKIYITTRMRAINETGDTTRPGNSKISDSDLNKYKERIIRSIRKAWNSSNYTIDIIDDHCINSYKIEFNPVFVQGNAHYEVRFYNEPILPNGRSVVHVHDRVAVLNLGDPHSVKNSRRATLEAHEYGHMLGLLDEYEELSDIDGDGDGLDLVEYELGTNKRTGRVIQDADGQDHPPKDKYDPSKFDYKWEHDFGGVQYIWPEVTGLPKEASPDTRGFMGRTHETLADRKVYLITVIYAIIDVLKQNGRSVTKINIRK